MTLPTFGSWQLLGLLSEEPHPALAGAVIHGTGGDPQCLGKSPMVNAVPELLCSNEREPFSPTSCAWVFFSAFLPCVWNASQWFRGKNVFFLSLEIGLGIIWVANSMLMPELFPELEKLAIDMSLWDGHAFLTMFCSGLPYPQKVNSCWFHAAFACCWPETSGCSDLINLKAWAL